ncbi:hypothetical protein JCM17961_47590 [Endothiovibrio diazotrophicus]
MTGVAVRERGVGGRGGGLLVPTLCVGTSSLTLRVMPNEGTTVRCHSPDAERPKRGYDAERRNQRFSVRFLVPTLCVGTSSLTLRVMPNEGTTVRCHSPDAERPKSGYDAERRNQRFSVRDSVIRQIGANHGVSAFVPGGLRHR